MKVIVTTQRREESLQRAAVPVTAISGEALGRSPRPYHAGTGSDTNRSYLGPDDKWDLAAYIDNIEDEEVVSVTFPHPFAGDLFPATMRPPIIYGARLRMNF